MDELYEIYGKLMIEAEILQSKINAVKQQIVSGINAHQTTTEIPTEEVSNEQ